MDKVKKIQGAIISGAIGDALGFIIEKQSIEKVRNFCQQLITEGTYSIPFRTYPRKYKFGQYSDDTQFSKILSISYLENKSFKALLVDEFKKDSLVGLGKNTRSLLKYYSKNLNFDAPLSMRENISNGALMRSWVIGLLFSNNEKIKEESEIHSKLTHETKESLLTCTFLAQVISLVLENDQFSKSEILDLCPDDYKELLSNGLKTNGEEELRQLLLYKPLEKEWEGVPPFAVQTLVASLVTFLKHKDDSLKELLCSAYLLGGDTDSTGSISGALWGCYNGINKVDTEFRDIVHDEDMCKEDYLMDLAKSIGLFRI